MTGEDKDHFERLSQLAPPEPDPEKIKATVAMSGRAFAQGTGKKAKPAKKGWLETLLPGRGWLIPASGLAGVLLVAAVTVPMMLDQTGQSFEAARDMPMPAPSVAEGPRSSAGPGAGTRMGSMPQRQRQGLPLDMRSDAEVQTYDFDGLEILSRSVPEEFGLYLVNNGVEREFDRRAKEASEQIVLTDAFMREGATGEYSRALFVRSGYDDGPQQWDAFIDNGSGFAISGRLSVAVHDANDRADVLARLAEAGGS
ncbi:hypothetical protein FPY71_02235 [Aureimonas fodinaquatilis]|uniref:Uncharacterized protein n=1 Tax=Aureimonas fodinaquatilis TaxID=2565783 RepID=A0A5B0E1H0_9HYPH|nr:hypothetical protein [Aureimonas fodinaquatilis]KAA0971965.1 hypothetical protein FPY71_02235 [Aureimonas fodinaquatilis]